MDTVQSKSQMKKRLSRLAALLIAGLLWSLWALAGCTVHRLEIGPTLEHQWAVMEDGHMNLTRILDQLGPPAKVSSLPNGFVFLYEFYAPEMMGVGGRIPIKQFENFDPFRLDIGGGSAQRQVVLLFFDENGLLVPNPHYHQDKMGIGSGARLSFLFKFGDLIEFDYDDERAGLNQWGMSLLQPLQKALNRQQDMESGFSGVELIDTPTSVGQNTLGFD